MGGFEPRPGAARRGGAGMARRRPARGLARILGWVASALVASGLGPGSFGGATAFAWCEGQGDAVILVKGGCAPGSRLKFRIGGAQDAKYRLWRSAGAGPTERDGIGRFCLDFDETLVVVGAGRLNPRGFSAVATAIPEDPSLIGRSLHFQAAVKDRREPTFVAISNRLEIPICDGCYPLGEHPGDIRRLGVIGFAVDRGAFPKTLALNAESVDEPVRPVGEIELVFDPADRPEFPVVSPPGRIEITDVTVIGNHVLVHFSLDGSTLDDGRLPTNTRTTLRVGATTVENVLHSSDRLPAEVGQWITPYDIVRVERAAERNRR